MADNEDNLVTSNMAEDVTIRVSNILQETNKDEEFNASLISTNENINHGEGHNDNEEVSWLFYNLYTCVLLLGHFVKENRFF